MTAEVAVIGSFRQHYDEVVAAVVELVESGLTVTTPPISSITNPGELFVRFELDPPHVSDGEIQAATLKKILSSDAVYVVAPNGYIGRTTCYELGRVHEKGVPVFYSEVPVDLPLEVQDIIVCDAVELRDRLDLEKRES
ncbi:hypothetical protein ACFWNN_18965 [Lentzea sp. NPDC058450]|uniref:hypothetical protein n=1 Tax=Lentzea sp. NPDC058450 TaxID=3346505 RepID=UPI0036483202